MTLTGIIIASVVMASSLSIAITLVYGICKGDVWLDRQITLTRRISYILTMLFSINTLFTLMFCIKLIVGTTFIIVNPF